ncbi:hypothetical protein VD0002_g7817 [Verticillium dahliae]|uniref:Uncharacterized protein n=1 Tax=Verticillium dahliae TaxID=27337 RepID=A0AA44WRJ0_VERDA|nr:Putative aminodeoxychorismate synthase [Verticillium dahliae VDG2]KAH6698587.1 hypothetical protein EV126DRAFT_424659 [Verticillium dahliae]PNH35567.1 hypothetical protein BJF96_g1457 [Verticillium dahliae]PNH59758.1 hypothetical protein VD0002_g7817 [Verticillium dahliae]
MNSLWPSRPPKEESETSSDEPKAEAADPGEQPSDTTPEQDNLLPPPPPPPVSSSRPGLIRNSSIPPEAPTAPAPPVPMPPVSSASQPPTDSLSLMQLRKIVAEFNKAEPVAYDFAYEDAGPHEEEIDEWFSYQFWQWVRLNAVQSAFESQWQSHYDMASWTDVDDDARTDFLREALDSLQASQQADRLDAARVLLYLSLGRWVDTAVPTRRTHGLKSAASPSQLDAIKSQAIFLTSLDGLRIVWQSIQDCFEAFWSEDQGFPQPGSAQDAQDELLNLMTVLYITIQETLSDPSSLEATRSALLALNPGLVNFMSLATSKVRWDETNTLPLNQILLLLWKSILLVFGGIDEIVAAKRAVSETDKDEKSAAIISASPLDYHTFRQELTSKYPAYLPPAPAINLEAESTTILPPPSNQPPRASANGIIPVAPNTQSGGASILNQPVHIATPAPSPPPSPSIGGKGGKKQNYQTNQNFPFMYPPLDTTSNSAGGKGGAGLQDTLVGRKWKGSDIPASILEAGNLFSDRVRLSRAMRQLWDERVRFMQTGRGWQGDSDDDVNSIDLDPDIDPEEDLGLDLSDMTPEERELIASLRGVSSKRKAESEPLVDYGPHSTIDEDVKSRLLAVESFYQEMLPHLQSLVIVLLRPIFMNVSALSQPGPAQQHPSMAGRGANAGVNGGPGQARQQQDPSAPGAGAPEPPEMSPEEVDATRSREITTKAATGTLLLLLKWLKLSHVLKFEYLTQLLLDHNYLPLVLKLFAHQDIQQAVDSKTDRIENSFFHFCNLRSSLGTRDEPPAVPAPEDEDELIESEDDAAPPPIRRQRSPSAVPIPETSEEEQEPPEGQTSARPEVDELGYPVNPLPMEPITDFSRRNFLSLINYLRIMQKICKRKAHRNLLLVQYKSSNILRKSLKVPQQELRLYTLKLFKNQVPYCGRKWRQSNMRVITAVYLHVRPELRDEWLAGSDVDAEVDSALPLEQAIRSLTHWFNMRKYPEQVAGDLRSAYREKQSFFMRELEKLGMNWHDAGGDDMVNMQAASY